MKNQASFSVDTCCDQATNKQKERGQQESSSNTGSTGLVVDSLFVSVSLCLLQETLQLRLHSFCPRNLLAHWVVQRRNRNACEQLTAFAARSPLSPPCPPSPPQFLAAPSVAGAHPSSVSVCRCSRAERGPSQGLTTAMAMAMATTMGQSVR